MSDLRLNGPIGVIGQGRVGCALATTLARQGFQVQVNDHRPLKIPGGLNLHETELERLAATSRCIVLTVQDDSIHSLVTRLENMDHSPLELLIICSGSTTLESLSGFGGVSIAKLHPLFSFSQREYTPFVPGIPWAIQADPSWEEPLIKLVESWDGLPHILQKDQWKSYHLAAVVASNFLPVLIRAGIELMQVTGRDASDCSTWLEPLVLQSVRNGLNLERQRPYSGPASRGDLQIMQEQIAQLEFSDPELAKAYRALSAIIMQHNPPASN